MAEKIIAEYQLDTTKFRQQVNGIVKSLDEVEKEGKQAGSETEKSFDKAGKSAVRFSNNVKDSGNQLESIKTTITKFAGAVGIAFGVQEVLKFTKATIDAASDLNETFTKVDQLFGTSTDSVKEWSKTTAASLGQSQQQALDAASTFAIFGRSAGLSGDDLVKFSTDFTALASDLASFNNTTPEEAIQAIGAALRGENEPIRRYGVLLDDASLKQAALKEGIISSTKEALTPQQKVLAAQIAIYQQTTAAQGDFARTSDGLANQQRILAAQFANLQAEIGQALLPVMLQFVKALNAMVTGDFPAFGDAISKLNDQLNPLGLGIGGIINAFENFKAAIEFILDGNYEEGIKKIGQAFLDSLGAVNPLVAVYRKLAEELFGVNNELSETEQLEQRLTARQNTFNNAVLEGGEALEIFRKRAKEVLGATDAEFDKYVATQRKRLEVTAMNNEKDAKSISLLQAMQKEVAAITERIQTQILTGGPISQKDIDRLNLLQTKLKELPIILKGVLESTQAGFGQVSDELITAFAPDASFLEQTKSGYDAALDEATKFLDERRELEIEDDILRRQRAEEYAQLEKQYNQQRIEEIQAAIGVAGEVFNSIANIVGQVQERQREDISRTTQEQIRAIETSTLSEEEKAKRIEALRKKEAQDQYELQRKQFAVNKAIAIVQTVINTAQAIVAQFANPTPFAGAALAALAAATGAAQIALIASQQPPAPAFAEGTEFVQRGRNKAGVDTVPAMLNEGEAVIPTDKNKAYPGLAKAWIGGSLDDYIVRNFVAPKLVEMERKAERRMADSFAASLKGDGFDDARLLLATSEGNMYLKTIAKEMKNKPKKRTAW
jgi:hypothetical protein